MLVPPLYNVRDVIAALENNLVTKDEAKEAVAELLSLHKTANADTQGD